MKVLSRIARAFVYDDQEKRNSPERPSTSLANPASWLKALFSPRGKSGAVVTADSVMGISGVWRAVNLICESLASMPAEAVKEDDSGIKVERTHRVHKLLNIEPHKLYTPFDWFYTMTGICLINGNSFSYIKRGVNGEPQSLKIINTQDYSIDAFVDEKDNLFYKIKGLNNDKPIPSDDIIHFKWMTTNGVYGLNTINKHQDTFGVGVAARDLTNYFFKNRAHLGGHIEYPNELTDTQYDRLKKSWNAAYGGTENAGKTAVLEEGAKFVQHNFDPSKSQMIEAQKFNVEDVARVFGVPPHLLASLDRATFNNIEQLSLEFAKYTIRPWAARIEQELNRKLFRTDERGKYRVRFDMSAFMRGDMDSLAEFLSKMVTSGIYSINDARKILDKNPTPGGDTHFVPVQMGALQEDGTLKIHEQQSSNEQAA